MLKYSSSQLNNLQRSRASPCPTQRSLWMISTWTVKPAENPNPRESHSSLFIAVICLAGHYYKYCRLLAFHTESDFKSKVSWKLTWKLKLCQWCQWTLSTWNALRTSIKPLSHTKISVCTFIMQMVADGRKSCIVIF